ncbi:carcinine hydrolase/isopenicillin-N N-acyltransferase family protein [Francisella sp. SYW-9]|uniref:carcinine hydrolase/isopenicillin-N N-acyltransferase family protein n=1 Tax=Francisella sp. SYW-9 TaxID=2610888 RepID=UPI00123CEC0F|nr:carcinine hydrolase/isopenicillin-N N-acyltransferase family protein [Francisella sp. SYW-9]
MIKAIKKYFYSLVLVGFLSHSAYACTAIAASGKMVEGGGTLLAKNRDASPFEYEQLKVVKPKQGYSYIALVYGKTKNNMPYISSGINQYGLAITMNDESSRPNKDKNIGNDVANTIKTILMKYKTIKDVQEHAQSLFGNSELANYTLSDSTQVASFQVGAHDMYAEKVTSNGVVWNTNYYNLKLLKKQNIKIPFTTAGRNKTLQLWLKRTHTPYKMGDLYQLLGSYYNGPYSSISRDVTIAKFMVINHKGIINVYVNFTNSTQRYIAYRFDITPKFFESQKEGEINKKYSIFEQMKIYIEQQKKN